MSDASDYISETCKVCGKRFSFCLIDTSREEARLACCKKGHNFCAEHSQEVLNRIEKSIHFWNNEDSEIEESEFIIDDICCENCPVCNKA